jgi:mRNA-degrading endonuclease toxin of MazEF toxin-antitoxin module
VDRGDLFRAPFQYADPSGKWRPAVVVSPAAYNVGPDVILAMVTSQLAYLQRPGAGDVVLGDWRAAGLSAPSVVRTGRLLVIEQRFLGAPLGRLGQADLLAVEVALRRVLAL